MFPMLRPKNVNQSSSMPRLKKSETMDINKSEINNFYLGVEVATVHNIVLLRQLLSRVTQPFGICTKIVVLFRLLPNKA